MSLSMPNRSRTFTILSGASITTAPRLAGLALGKSGMVTLYAESGEGGAGFEVRISLYHRLQSLLVAAVAAIMVGMVAAQEVGIAAPERAAVGVGAEAEDPQRLAVRLAQFAAVEARALGGGAAEAGSDRVEGVVDVGPFGRAVGAHVGEGAGLAVPAAIRIVGGLDLVAADRKSVV